MGAKGKKKMTQKLVRVPKSVQDTIPISRIAKVPRGGSCM